MKHPNYFFFGNDALPRGDAWMFGARVDAAVGRGAMGVGVGEGPGSGAYRAVRSSAGFYALSLPAPSADDKFFETEKLINSKSEN
jgi:hypothetical protein